MEESPSAAGQAFGIGPYLEQATTRLQRYFSSGGNEALVIGVFGEWGSGKSTLLAEISKRFLPGPPSGRQPDALAAQTLCVNFNPWRYERESHLLIPLLRTASKALADFLAAQDPTLTALANVDVRELRRSSIMGPIRRLLGQPRVPATQETPPLQWLANRAMTLTRCAIAATKMLDVKLQIPGVGEVGLKPADGLEAALKQIDRGNDELAKGRATALELDSLYYDLHNELHKVTRGDPLDAHRLNFLFLVDDIDRCLPDKAVEMLEAIKLFLDIPGCAFVLALDDEVVERGIAHRYRDYLDLTDRSTESIAYALRPERYREYVSRFSSARLAPITGHEYLEKIVHLPFRLPRWSKTEIRGFLRERYSGLFPAAPTPQADDSEKSSRARAPAAAQPPSRDWLLDLFVQAVPPVPRKLVRACELFDFTFGVVRARGLAQRVQEYTLAQVVLLQLFAPECYRYLRRERREAWLGLERRIDEARHTSREASDTSPPPDFSTPRFFEWWQRRVAEEQATDLAEGRQSNPYLERVEEPFITVLRQACLGRSGFDPRNLFLLSGEFRVDRDLEAYFTLYEPTPPTATSTFHNLRAAFTPRIPAQFVAQLMAPQEEAWRNAISAEEGLRQGVLDDATFDLLIAAVSARRAQVTIPWLEVVLPILRPEQVKRLYRESQVLSRLSSRSKADAMSDEPRRA